MKKMTNLSLILMLFIVIGCQEQTKTVASQDGVSGAATSAPIAGSNEIDFEKKEKDESCDTEEDLEKQIEEAKKKQEAFKLQGGDSGCSTDAAH